MLGVYVHVPYCTARCPYCDFNIAVVKQPPWQRFVDAVQSEVHRRAPLFAGPPLQSIYFGGGTPSLAPPEFLAQVMTTIGAEFGAAPGAERTVEVNPGSIDATALTALRRAGINRLSLGWQSTHDRLLKALGRDHSAADSRDCFAAARAAGFDNISIDLIFAVPGQSMTDLEADLDAVERLAPEHVSLYALTYKAGTEFERRLKAGRLARIDEDVELTMMLRIDERLAAAGYEHYEVSNYARPGRRAVHNALYWTGGNYLGVGPGAHSFAHADWQRGWRWEAKRDPAAYFAACALPSDGAVPITGEPHVEWVETLTPRQLMTERMMCGLRMRDGVDLREPALNSHRPHLVAAAEQATARGWAKLDGDALRPTTQGLVHADALAELFF